ncbi:signal peptidase I [Alkaliphilus transvaalensis]|uniref:signal peptidase I n=1 Tax=Alkaliphilus transvaalensis TaxID=114628 RepID=UPI000686FBFD|nr:signal peptidase I [Alkaliphilus transvaalensis]
MKKGNKKLKWISNGFIGLLVILVMATVFSNLQARKNPNKIPTLMGYSPMSVLTGSMRPMLEPGDMIITKNVAAEEIEVGDVITYRVDSYTLVTHRVIAIIEENGRINFQTQGDANNTIDQSLVTPEALVGSLVFRIPKGGYLVNFTRSPIGFLVCIIIPVLLLIGPEVKKILFEVGKEKKA